MVSVEQNSILKKISAVIVLITALVFLSFNVFATTYNPTTYNTFTDAFTVDNVTYSLRVTQLKALSAGTSMLPSGMETVMLVTFQINNRNNQDALCQVPQFSIDLSDQRVITDVYTYAGDLCLSLTTNGFVILPTEAFSYNQSSSIVVPSNSTLTLVGGIGLPAQLNQTGDGTLDTGLRNVHLLYKPYTVTLGSYQHGVPIDISPIVTYIDDLEDTLDDINAALTNIQGLISYTGTAFSQFNNPSSRELVNVDGYSGLTVRARRNIFSPYLVSEDIELNNTNDTIIQAGSVCYPVCISVYWRNSKTASDYTSRYYWQLQNIFPVTSSSTYYGFEITGFESNFCAYQYEYGSNLNLFFSNGDSIYSYMPANKLGYCNIWMKFYCPIGTVPTFDSLGLDIGTPTLIDADDGNVSNIFDLLRNWYRSYKNVNGVDDSSDVSNDVADVSDSNHIIEESYYSANASAIEATGLSNYHFSNEQNNGIGQVSSDFMLLWNALGSWNGVYIFSLTMALATFIMRHGGLFTIKRETSDKGGEGD